MAKNFSKYIKQGLLSTADIEFLATLDPSKTNKYLPFIIKAYLNSENLDQIRNSVSEYDTLVSRNLVERNDINSFKTFSQFNDYVQQHNNIKSTNQEKREAKKQAEIILDNENLFIVCPYSHAASCLYGAGSKWCITMENPVHFERYMGELVTFYFIQVRSEAIKSQLEEDLWKLAVVVYRGGRIGVYDAADKLVAGVNVRFQKFIPPDELFFTLGVEASLFVPRRTDERIPAIFAAFNTGCMGDLDLSSAGMTKVPEEIGNAKQLQSLTLSENRIEFLPEAIGMLTNLKCLYLFHNMLTSFPESLYNMKQLQWLGLTGNPLSNRTLRELKAALPTTRIYFEKTTVAQ